MILAAVTLAIKENVHVLIVDSTDYFIESLIGYDYEYDDKDLKLLLKTNNLGIEEIDLYSDDLIESNLSYVKVTELDHIEKVLRYSKEVFDFIFVYSSEGNQFESDVTVVNLPKDIIRIRKTISELNQEGMSDMIYLLGAHNKFFRHENIKRYKKNTQRDLIKISSLMNEGLNKSVNDQNIINYIISHVDCAPADDNYELFQEILEINSQIISRIERKVG